jgi:hypothetical protein
MQNINQIYVHVWFSHAVMQLSLIRDSRYKYMLDPLGKTMSFTPLFFEHRSDTMDFKII